MTRSILPALRALTLALALVGLGGGGAFAQAEAPFAEETLSAFVDAVIKVEPLMKERQSAMQAAETPEEAQRIQEQATQEMAAAVEETPGITVDEYLAINQALRQDEDLMKRVLALYGEAVKDGAVAQ